MSYLYARNGLRWSGFKSFLVALLVATYFVSLRNSWDLYAQSFGLIFLFATLIVLKANKSHSRYPLAFGFIILTVLSHELVTVILFFILGLQAIHCLVRKDKIEFAFFSFSLGVAMGLFVFSKLWLRPGAVFIPSADVAVGSSFALVSLFGGLLLYCYVLIVPLVALGFRRLKDWNLRYWIAWCLVGSILLVVFPSLPLYYWNRWVYLLVYPLLFFAVEGLSILWEFSAKNKVKIKRFIPKAFALSYMILLLTLSSFYLAVSPENQISFFSSNSQFLSFIPSSMLQNTLPISQNPSLVSCFNWINNNSANKSAIVVHYALYDLAAEYVHGKPIFSIEQNTLLAPSQNGTLVQSEMVKASRTALDAGNSAVYTVWWISGDGWYNVSSLPPNYKEVFRMNQMAVYIFDPMV